MTDVAAHDDQKPLPVRDEQDQDLLTLLQRERADFLNFRRRAAQERNEERERARLELLNALLPLLDDLDLALARVPPELAEHPWTRGLLLSRRRLGDFLAGIGLEPFGAEGELFDPARHEAVFYEQRPEYAVRRVETVVRPGYRLGGRIVRPAQVGVVGPVDDGTPAAIRGDDGVVATSDSQANDGR
jgi:molecular chaperone GrpE